MFDNLDAVENRHNEVNLKLSEPSVIANQDEYKRLMKEYSELEEIVTKYREYKSTLKNISDAEELLEDKLDKDFCELVEMELAESKENLEKIKKELKILLLPKDPNDDKNVIVEIRGGAGGEEAALFAGVLFRAYTRYAERKRWKTEILDSNPTELGGFKEVVFAIEGKGAYSRLKFESGVHRVQRIPSTASSGRIQTSTITVAIMAE
ncbi:MAG: PCRF domain-containing protein, partial [Bacillota bacterium]|nr:PCRF domain-containing protein [Bacillota bacterium]